jgi:hypothetical protein
MSDKFFLDLFNALSDEDFEERPVDIEEFVTSERFLNIKRMTEHQYSLVRAMSQIYREDTLISLYGEVEGSLRFKQTYREIIMQLGKGSGKDFTSTIAVAYVVYLLLCLKDPAVYYGNVEGDTIDIINIAINADQAQRVFFRNFKNRIESCHWFDGKYNPKNGSLEFIKNVNVYSGHSEREAFEGYNTFLVILDEISGFAMPDEDDIKGGEEDAMKKTAPGIYKMYRGSVTSRFPDFGKLVSLSFPRYKDDFIQQKYNEVVAEKEVIIRTATLKRDYDLPDGTPGNEFDISWEEDHILRYAKGRCFALRRPSWEVNPNRKIEDYADDFYDDPGDALGRFACMPSNLSDGFFKNKAAIEEAFVTSNGVDDDGIFKESFQPKEGVRYYVHVDLAQKHDHCAVAMGHVEKWVEVSVGAVYNEVHPFVVIDAVRYWTPTKSKSVDFADVRDYIISLRRRGFDIRLVTFDRWNSHDTMNILTKEHGMETDILSVAKKHYDDFLSVMYDHRLAGPRIQLLIDELGLLKLVKNKVDHPRKGSKDLSDAVCGAIFNAVSLTPKPVDMEVEVLTYAQMRAKLRKEQQDIATQEAEKQEREGEVIRAPKRPRPDWLNDYLARATEPQMF